MAIEVYRDAEKNRIVTDTASSTQMAYRLETSMVKIQSSSRAAYPSVARLQKKE